MAKYCSAVKTESKGSGYKTESKENDNRRNQHQKLVGAKKIESSSNENASETTTHVDVVDLLSLLHSSSDSDGGGVKAIRIQDEDSEPHCGRVLVQGVLVYGVVDITIIGGNLFQKVGSVACLKNKIKLMFV